MLRAVAVAFTSLLVSAACVPADDEPAFRARLGSGCHSDDECGTLEYFAMARVRDCEAHNGRNVPAQDRRDCRAPNEDEEAVRGMMASLHAVQAAPPTQPLPPQQTPDASDVALPQPDAEAMQLAAIAVVQSTPDDRRREADTYARAFDAELQNCVDGYLESNGTKRTCLLREPTSATSQKECDRACSITGRKTLAFNGTSVRCCDGSYSPSCTNGRDSLRGCCSHHGGVCAEQMPDSSSIAQCCELLRELSQATDLQLGQRRQRLLDILSYRLGPLITDFRSGYAWLRRTAYLRG